MTPKLLQDALTDELKRLLSAERLYDLTGALKLIAVHEQGLPREQTEGNDTDPVPYVVVKVENGSASAPDARTTSIYLIIAVSDIDPNANGYADVLHIIEKIYERFAKNPCMGEYRFTGVFNWALVDEDTYPYYFGGVELTFESPRYVLEDNLT